MKILIIDDEQRLLDALAIGFQFQWQDAVVLTAHAGEEGLQLFYDHTPDVVLLDVGMPGMNGFEVLKEIRRVSDVPVIMLTAAGDEMDHVHGLELGADDYIVKPFSRIALMAHIKAVLRRAQLPPPVEALPDFVAGDLAIDRVRQVDGLEAKARQAELPRGLADRLGPTRARGVGDDQVEQTGQSHAAKQRDRDRPVRVTGLLANRGRGLEANEQGDGEQDAVEDAVQRRVAGPESREGVTGVAALGDDRDGQDQKRDQRDHGQGEHAADR